MNGQDIIQAAVEGLVPPDAQPKSPRARYDAMVSLSLIGVIIVGALHVAQACGFLGGLGLGGFAMAKTVADQQNILVQIQISQLNRDMREAKTQICLAQRQINAAALDSWSRQLQNTRGLYYALTNRWPDVQSCEELLVPARSAAAAIAGGAPADNP